MNKDKIKQAILNTVFEYEDTVLDMRAVNAAADAIAALSGPQPASQTLSILFDELNDALEDIQLCDNTADEAEEAWTEISSIVMRFKSKAIVALPLDRVQAMALFVRGVTDRRYHVPDTEMKMHTVDVTPQGAFCHLTKNFTLCSRGDCEHARAVELYRGRQG